MKRHIKELIKKGIRKTHRTIPFLFGQVFPKSRWGPNSYVRQDGVVTFKYGGFVASPSGRVEFSSKLYYEVQAIRKNLNEFLPKNPVKNSLEIGCGYGRHSPWIAEFSKNHYAIDPNEEVLSKAKEQYPHIHFRNVSAQSMAFPDNYFDFVLTWTVLQHIPPKSIKSVAEEINRVNSDKGILIAAEDTKAVDEGPKCWGRSKAQYEDLFDLELVFSSPKPTERSDRYKDFEHPRNTLMVFSNIISDSEDKGSNKIKS